MALNLLPLYNSTFKKYLRGGFVDNVSQRVPLFNWMRKSKCLKPWDGSGKYVVEEVMTDLPNTMQALAAYEQISYKPVEGVQLVNFNVKEIVVTITISDREMKANTSKEKAIDLIETKMKQAELLFAEGLEEMLFSDGTAQGGKVMLGLAAFLPDDNTSGSLGGFPRSSNVWLRCPSSSGAKTTVGFDNLMAKLRNLKNTCSRGSIKPTIYITDQTVYEGYETLSYGKLAPTTKTEAKDLGFDGDLTFAGKPFVFADLITAGDLFALNPESLKFRVEGLKKSSDSPFQIDGPYDLKPHQKATVWILTLAGAVTANYFRQMGKLHSIT